MGDVDGDLTDETGVAVPVAYVPPAVEVLGTLEELTGGPDPGAGDVPTGVISF